MSGLDNKKPSNEDHQDAGKSRSFAEKIALLEANLPQLGAPKTSPTSRRSSTSSSTSAASSTPEAGAGAGSAATTRRKKVDTSALEALFKRPEAKPEPEAVQPATAEPAAAPAPTVVESSIWKVIFTDNASTMLDPTAHAQYLKMLKVQTPVGAVMQRMNADGVFGNKQVKDLKQLESPVVSATPEPTPEPTAAPAPAVVESSIWKVIFINNQSTMLDPTAHAQYLKMLKVQTPVGAVMQRMNADGVFGNKQVKDLKQLESPVVSATPEPTPEPTAAPAPAVVESSIWKVIFTDNASTMLDPTAHAQYLKMLNVGVAVGAVMQRMNADGVFGNKQVKDLKQLESPVVSATPEPTPQPTAAPSRPALPSNLAAQLVAKAGNLKKADETTASSQPAPNAGAGQADEPQNKKSDNKKPAVYANELFAAVKRRRDALKAKAEAASQDAAAEEKELLASQGLAADRRWDSDDDTYPFEKQQPAAGAGAGVVNAPVSAPREKPNAGAGQPPGVTPEPQAQQPTKSNKQFLNDELNKIRARMGGGLSDDDSDDEADYEDSSDDEQVDSTKYASKFISCEQVKAFLLSVLDHSNYFKFGDHRLSFVELTRIHDDASQAVERFVSAIETNQNSGIPIEQFHLMLNQLLAYPAKHDHWGEQDQRNHKRIYRELVAALFAQKQRNDESKDSEGSGVINFILTGQGDVEGRQWLRSLHNALIYGDPNLEKSVSRLEQELTEEQTHLTAEEAELQSSVDELNSLKQEHGAISTQLDAALGRLTNLNLELQPYAVDSTMVQEIPSTITPMVTVQQEPMRSPEALAEQGEASVALSSPALPVTTVSEGVNVSNVVDQLKAYANPGCCFHWRNWTKEAKAIKSALKEKKNTVTQAELLAILRGALTDTDRLLKPQGTSLGVSKFTKILVDLVNAVAVPGSLNADGLIKENKEKKLTIADFLAKATTQLTPGVEQNNPAAVVEVKLAELMEPDQHTPVEAVQVTEPAEAQPPVAMPPSPTEQRCQALLDQKADADAHVARLNAELESLNGRIQDAQSQITQHEGRIAKHEQRIPELNASLEAARKAAEEEAARLEAEAKAQAEREAQAKREAEEAARKAAEAEAKARAEREAQAKREAEEAARLEAEAKAQAEREKRGKRAAEKPALVAQVKAPAQPKRKAIRKPVPAVPVAANTDLPQPAAAPTVSAPFNDAFSGVSAAAGDSRVPLAGAGGDHYSVSTDASSVKDALVMKPAHADAAGGYMSLERFKLLVAELLEKKSNRHSYTDNRIAFLTDRCNEKQGLSLTLVQSFVNELCDSKNGKSVRDALRADINHGKIKGKQMSSDLRALLPAAESVTYKKPGFFGSPPEAKHLASLLGTLRAMQGELAPSVAPV